MKLPKTQTLGFPRIGNRRELKKSVESYWAGKSSEEELQAAAAEIRRTNWLRQASAGIDLIPCNDFSFYDHVLDTSCLFGNVPERFGWDGGEIGLDLMFRMARGAGDEDAHDCAGCEVVPQFACEMTKWFDTNYHYIVPEFNERTQFKIASTKVFDELAEAKQLNLWAKPVLVGPLTYLMLGKEVDVSEGFSRFDLADQLIDTYCELLKRLVEQGATWVQLDEPVLALDLSERDGAILMRAYEKFAREVPELQIMLATYFGGLGDNLETAGNLQIAGLHIDGVRGASEIDRVIDLLPEDRVLSLGVIDGRNIWKGDLEAALRMLRPAAQRIGAERLIVSPSCSLLHVPVSLEAEEELDPEIRGWMAFADEKLLELRYLRDALDSGETSPEITANAAALHQRRLSPKAHNPAVEARIVTVREEQFSRKSPFAERQSLQREKLQLPEFPTTTIGSFPQTAGVRKARAKKRTGVWSDQEYETFLRLKTSECIIFQESAGIDVLVHGEFERNDMVEYFGEKLEGFAFTRYGWVQSYGTRCVKPPVIFGDVSRPEPMTVRWSAFAQSLTTRPVKGMLTGPVTILQWSFVRDDQPRSETAQQIALAIRDEAVDLEAAGLRVIQIDEPALREGLPLLKAEHAAYLEWAVKAFRLAASGVRDDTQIHTHMCYCEFNDIIGSIADLDADVITIETARSNLELLNAFVEFHYPNEIGPGVYDIHSPRVPTVEEMEALLQKAAELLPAENIWVNPDCGLKTRGWEETKEALTNMVIAAKSLRSQVLA